MNMKQRPPSLIVGEPDASSTRLFRQDFALFFEIVDDLQLLEVDPAREHRNDKLPWSYFHAPNVP